MARPRPGLREVDRPALHVIGDVRVHLIGGNASTDRVDLVLDTRVGSLVHGAVWNSAHRRWTWRHEMRLEGDRFVDESGAELDWSTVADGEAIPGTHWVRVDATHVKTKGGRVYAFDPSDGRLVEVYWLDVPLPRLRYVSEPVAEPAGGLRLTRVEQCTASGCRDQLSLAYDETGCLTSVIDRAGRRAAYVNDGACRTLVARDGLDVEQGLAGRRYEYGGSGSLRAIVTSEGERTELEYRGEHLSVVRRVGEGSPTHRFTHTLARTGYGGTVRMETPEGHLWHFEYDAKRRLVRRSSPEGDVETWSWAGHRPATRTDAAGETWHFEYEDDDLVRLETPAGEVVQWVHARDAVDRSRPTARPVERVVDDLGVREQRTYDAAGRLTTIVDGAGEVTSLDWSDGELVRLIGPDGLTVSLFDYGEHGHPTRIVRGGVEEVRLYDAVGNLEKGAGLEGELAPGRPGLVRRQFDADRNVAVVRTIETRLDSNAAPEKVTTIERRSDGRPLRIVTPYGGEETFVYDALGRLVERRERVDGVAQVTSIESDLEGHPRRAVRPNGMVTELDWDRDGRLTRIERRHAGAATETLALSWGGGRVVRLVDGAHADTRVGEETFDHGPSGRVRAIHHPDGGRTELDYDARGRVIRRRVFGASYGARLFEVTRTWDGAGRPLSTRLDGELLIERVWSGGTLRERRFGNGLVRQLDYDADTGLLAATATTGTGGESIESTTITRSGCEPDVLCIAVVAAVRLAGPEGGAPLWNGEEEHYQLMWFPTAIGDLAIAGSWLRMSSPQPFEAIADGDRVQLDALGNVVGHRPRGGPAVAFAFNAERNRLMSGGFEATHTYVHDAAGFVVERDGVALRWTAGGRLAAIGDEVQLEWDALGRLRSRTLRAETTRYIHGGTLEVDQQGWPVATEIDGVRVALGTTLRRYRHVDFRGNVQFVSDESGRVLRHHAYDAYRSRTSVGRDGAPRAPEDGERGFAQGIHLADLQLMGARPYDPDVGRFLAPDPIDHVLNDFAYTRGNPVLLWDPGGTEVSMTPGGQAMVAIGAGFMTVGAAVIGAGIALGSPPVAGTGVIIFTVGVVITAAGGAMTQQVAVDSGGDVASSAEESGLEASGQIGAATCAPDDWRPGRLSIDGALGVGVLMTALLCARRIASGGG